MTPRILKIGNRLETVYHYDLPTNPEEAWEFIKRERQVRYEYGGFKVGDLWFHSDTESILSYLGLAVGTNENSIITGWKTMSGFKTDMTFSVLRSVIISALMTKRVVFNAGETHWENIMNFTTPEQFRNYNYFSNWPPAYFDV